MLKSKMSSSVMDFMVRYNAQAAAFPVLMPRNTRNRKWEKHAEFQLIRTPSPATSLHIPPPSFEHYNNGNKCLFNSTAAALYHTAVGRHAVASFIRESARDEEVQVVSLPLLAAKWLHAYTTLMGCPHMDQDAWGKMLRLLLAVLRHISSEYAWSDLGLEGEEMKSAVQLPSSSAQLDSYVHALMFEGVIRIPVVQPKRRTFALYTLKEWNRKKHKATPRATFRFEGHDAVEYTSTGSAIFAQEGQQYDAETVLHRSWEEYMLHMVKNLPWKMGDTWMWTNIAMVLGSEALQALMEGDVEKVEAQMAAVRAVPAVGAHLETSPSAAKELELMTISAQQLVDAWGESHAGMDPFEDQVAAFPHSEEEWGDSTIMVERIVAFAPVLVRPVGGSNPPLVVFEQQPRPSFEYSFHTTTIRKSSYGLKKFISASGIPLPEDTSLPLTMQTDVVEYSTRAAQKGNGVHWTTHVPDRRGSKRSERWIEYDDVSSVTPTNFKIVHGTGKALRGFTTRGNQLMRQKFIVWAELNPSSPSSDSQG